MAQVGRVLFSCILLATLAIVAFAGRPGLGDGDGQALEPYDALIDRMTGDAWKKAGLTPAPCDDATFLRRVSLDACGVIPGAAEVEAFLRDGAKDKRERKVDELLLRPEAATHWANVWTATLLGRQYELNARGVSFDLFHDWLRTAWEKEQPWNALVTELLVAAGPGDVNGPVSFVIKQGSKENLIGNVSKVFLGVPIQCAQCHDHPYAPWSQKDFYGMLAFVSRTEQRQQNRADIPPDAMEVMSPEKRERIEKRLGKAEKEKAYRRFIVFERRRGEARLPTTGEAIAPRFLSGEGIDPGESRDRRRLLAAFVTADGNPRFSRAFINRMWAQYMGRGFIEPLEDLEGGAQDARLPSLLRALATRFTDGGYAVKPLIRGILLSKAYQVAATHQDGGSGARKSEAVWASRIPRQLSPEQVLFSMMEASGIENVRGVKELRGLARKKEQVLRAFIFATGDDEEADEEAFTGTIPRALLFMNSPWMDRGVTVFRGGTLAGILQRCKDTPARVRALFLCALSREPVEEELLAFTAAFAEAGPDGARAVLEDAFWALLNSAEFSYNH